MSNRLAYEKSPYLLQHKDNPVDWYPWGEEAFQKAKEEEKPILLSIGYSTCHWCHVMGRESFENQEIADYLNRHFISIKVDREERPDIDAIYMSVCQGLTGDGGWPLTVFLTPERKPFFAGTYFPEETRYGRIGFLQLLRQIVGLWHSDRAKLTQAGGQITAALAVSSHQTNKEPDRKLLTSAYRMLERSFDPVWGGFGQAPKFPTPHVLLFLMAYGSVDREISKQARPMVKKTLSAMSQGGIFDQIGGGFCRYSTDERWLVPHFEKMLYDNALLLLCYTCAYQQFGSPEYARVARMTADYMLRELKDAEGGFYCGQDADSEGEEGKYYLLIPEEICSVLGEEKGTAFCRVYHISEDMGIPNRIEGQEPAWSPEDSSLAVLYEYRKSRVSLHTDDKILLSWNSWAILALTQAGIVLGEKAYLDGALQAQKFIQEHMTVDRKLYRRYREREAAIPGQLEDYAVYVLALLGLYRATWEVSFLEQAIDYGKMFRHLFEDSVHGGFYMNREDETLIARLKETGDGAIPSGNSAAQLALEALAGLTGEPEWRKAADRQHRFMAEHVEKSPTGHCFSLLSMLRVLYPTKELVVTANKVPPALIDYLRAHSGSQWSILLKTRNNAEALSECVPFTASFSVPDGENAVYYLCENGVCTKKSENVF